MAQGSFGFDHFMQTEIFCKFHSFAPLQDIYHKYPVNVLILTPDAVGSTLLQRLLTIYMQFHEFDRPVINLHELTNGLEKYYSAEFGREIVSKRGVQSWGYYQSLSQIVEILHSVDHYKTSRLAQYHIKNRGDTIDQQIPFYRYLDDNFFIISCRRNNIFEHALSMTLNKITKKLNVYNHAEKIETFYNIYKDKVELDLDSFVYSLDAYKDYIDWSGRYFNVGSYFYYDEHLAQIERYILNLPVFNGQNRQITWAEKFGIDFNNWNRCHQIPSDLSRLSFEKDSQLQISGPSCENISADINQLACIKQHTLSDIKTKNFMEQHQPSYDRAMDTIKRMIELDIIGSPPPIKKQTLLEKISIIKNINLCIEIYNQWISQNPDLGLEISMESIGAAATEEQDFWKSLEPTVETARLAVTT
jgi:hypothetical protein